MVYTNVLIFIIEGKNNLHKFVLKFKGEISKTTIKYRGPYWSHLTGKQRIYTTDSNPGPGSYDPEIKGRCPSQLESCFMAVREMKRGTSKLRRFPEYITRKVFLEVYYFNYIYINYLYESHILYKIILISIKLSSCPDIELKS